ncbi:MAG: hypothetical protein MUF08_02335 [Burkholderiaceae bacterium]|nr:hypothetical protein [Burkholderiaceae bacterium]
MQATAALTHADALRTAAAFGVSACGARFLAAVKALGTKRVTEDAGLHKAAPALNPSLAQALAD